MNLKPLRTLIELGKYNCDFGIHTNLGLTRSTLWSHINEIEKETGLKLINRRKRHSHFTKEGLAFLPCAEKMYDLYEATLNDISIQTEELAGEINLSTTKAVGTSWLIPSVKEFHSKFPNMKVRFNANDHLSNKVRAMSDILLRPVADKTLEGFESLWHIKYHMALFASPGYLKENGTPEEPGELVNHLILGYGTDEFTDFPNINWYLNGSTSTIPRIVPYMTINSTASLFKAALEDLGIVALPSEITVINKQEFDGELVRVLPDIQGPIIETHMCIRTGCSEAKRRNMESYIKFIEDHLKKRNAVIHYTNKA